MNGRASSAAIMATMLGMYAAPVLGKSRKGYTVETGPKLCGDRELDNIVQQKAHERKAALKKKKSNKKRRK